jgi:hypothetical protein
MSSLTTKGVRMKRKILVVVLLCMMAIVVPIVNTSSESDNLKKADLVYRSGAIVFGHSGIYIGDGKVIEVVTSDQLPPYGGAREITLDEFKKDGIYWGAKTKSELDENKREKIVDFAKKAVEETKEGKIQYDFWHPKGDIVKNGKKLYNCVGFTEAAYESVDIDLVPGDGDFLWHLTPKGQMRSSELEDVKSELPEGKDLGGIDFSSIQLNYISVFSEQDEEIFSYVLKAKKAEKGDEIIDLEDATELSLNSFFIGLSIPNDEFWVNLNPWESDRIIEDDLVGTDVGKILLDADFQMKRDFCKYEDPCTGEIGETYWALLDKKQEELVSDGMNKYPGQIKEIENVLFQTATRHWIVPDRIDVYGNENEIYVINSTLNIYSEPVYNHSTFEIVNQDASSLSKECLDYLNETVKEYGRYAAELEEEMILPLVVQDMNSNTYADLRQVYVSLALAQWYKEHADTTAIFSDFIDSRNLTVLESQTLWSATDIWEEYVKSYREGEYHCWKNRTYHTDEYLVTESKFYSSGGVDFSGIRDHIREIDDIPQKLKEITSEAIYTTFAKEGNNYYFSYPQVAVRKASEKLKFDVTNLVISPANVKVGKPITIKVDVKNNDVTEGTTIISITINGKTADSKEVTLAPGEMRTLTFTQIPSEKGPYGVTVDGKKVNTVVTPGFEVILAITGLLAVAMWSGKGRANERKKAVK